MLREREGLLGMGLKKGTLGIPFSTSKNVVKETWENITICSNFEMLIILFNYGHYSIYYFIC